MRVMFDELKPDETLIQMDVFITSTGFEERSKGAIDNYEIKVNDLSYVIQYTELKLQDKSFISDNNLYKNYIVGKLKMRGPSPVILEVQPFVTFSTVKQILSELRGRYGNKQFSIGVDISTMTKVLQSQLLFYILKFFDNAEVTIFYTEPTEYGNNLTRGVEKLIFVEPFEKGLVSSKKDLLVEFLSMEPQRNKFLLENLEFDDFILLMPEKDKRRRIDPKRYVDANRSLVDFVDGSTPEVSLIDPNKVKQVLFDLLESKTDRYSDFNVFISPSGSKLQALGLVLYLTESENVPIIVYAAPQGYLLDFSKGVGKTIAGRITKGV